MIFLKRVNIGEEAKEKTYKMLSEYGIARNKEIFLFNLGDGRIPLREWPLSHFIELSKKIFLNRIKTVTTIQYK